MCSRASVRWMILSLVLLALSPVLAGGADSHVAEEGGFRAVLILASELLNLVTEATDEIRWGSHAAQMREIYPACAYIADNSENYLWYPFIVQWTDSTDVRGFDPDVCVSTEKLNFRMKEIFFFNPKGERLDYVKLGSLTSLKPDKYIIRSFVPEDASPNMAMGMIAFDRSRKLTPKKIEGIRFTADRENRPLEQSKKN